ncbi:MAG: hypothetical protein V1809_16785 [Planctomycetota bacterium]
MMPWILAAADAAGEGNASTRQFLEKVSLEYSGQRPSIIPFVIIFGALIIAFLTLRIVRRFRMSDEAREVREFYERLQRVHDLTDVERRALDQMVRGLGFDNPSVIFVRPTLFRSAVEAHLGKLKTPDSRRNFERFYAIMSGKLFG